MNIELTSEQIKVLNSKSKGHCLIKGVAGSGKTTLALYKVMDILKELDYTKENILLLTYNKLLIKYMKRLCKENKIMFDKDQLKIKTMDSLIYGYVAKDNRKIASDSEKRTVLRWAIQQVQQTHGKDTIAKEENMDFLLEEFNWIKSCNYVKKEDYLSVERLGRIAKGNSNMRLQKNGEDRKIIFELFQWYEKEMERRNLTDFYSNALRVLNRMENKQIYWKKYSYILVDESQDLTKVQLEIIKKITKRKKEVVSGFLQMWHRAFMDIPGCPDIVLKVSDLIWLESQIFYRKITERQNRLPWLHIHCWKRIRD